MTEWKEEKLGNVAQLQKKSWQVGDRDLPYIALEHIVEGGLRLQGISNSKTIVSNKYHFDSDCFLFGKLRPYFRKLYRPYFEGICSTDIWVVKPKNDNDKDFLFYFFANQEFVDFTYAGSSGTRMPRADWNFVSESMWKFPEPSEQKTIASVLSSLDDKIDLLYRQNKTLEEMAEALFRQWFVVEASEEWEERTLDEVLEFIVDNRGKTAPTSDFGIPLIATNCVKNSNLFPVYEKVRYISDDIYENWFRAHPKPGDILFVNKGTPGCVNLVPDPVDFCIAQDMIALRVNNQILNNYFLFLYLRQESVQSDILNTSVGTTIPHLKKTDLLQFKITVPPINLINDFNNMVEPFFLKMNENNNQIRTLEKLRDTLLPKLMSGEVRVTMEN